MGLRSKICILGLLVVFSSAAAYADEKRSNFSKIDKNSTLGWLKYPTEPSPERRGEKKNEVIRKYQLPPKTKNNVYKAMLPAFYQDLDFDAYYRFTFEDLVWATLAIEGETDCDGREHSAAVLWTIAQRGGINPKRRLSNDKSYADALIEYCQPIKPKWAN
ncbi:MAG TPA: hypothetical protein PLH57_12375, partial [Oligoflexia bacterium]|nr:hypothetical protein [Oligoflexia bacterium]